MIAKGTEVHLDALRIEIQRRFGRPILTKTDCQNLEERLYDELGSMVSYNTLRRFFGLVPGGTPRGAVLDILSTYCGFATFKEFTLDVRRFHFTTTGRKLLTEIDGPNRNGMPFWLALPKKISTPNPFFCGSSLN
jgi:hypothetical protein